MTGGTLASFFVLSLAAIWLYWVMPFGNPVASKIAKAVFFDNFNSKVTQARINTIDEFVRILNNELRAGNDIQLDEATLALVPEGARATNRLAHIPDTAAYGATEPDFAVIFFRTYMQAGQIRQDFAAAPDAVCYVLPGTNIGAVARGAGLMAAPETAVHLREFPCDRI